MSDWIEVDRKKYFEEGYLQAANATATRLKKRVQDLEAHVAEVEKDVQREVDGARELQEITEQSMVVMAQSYQERENKRDAEIRRLRGLVAEAVKGLERFAAMHREGCDLSELACERGIASDMTIITSADWANAAALHAKLTAVTGTAEATPEAPKPQVPEVDVERCPCGGEWLDGGSVGMYCSRGFECSMLRNSKATWHEACGKAESERDAARKDLAEAVEALQKSTPSCRGENCWCPAEQGFYLQRPHTAQCKANRAIVARFDAQGGGK